MALVIAVGGTACVLRRTRGGVTDHYVLGFGRVRTRGPSRADVAVVQTNVLGLHATRGARRSFALGLSSTTETRVRTDAELLVEVEARPFRRLRARIQTFRRAGLLGAGAEPPTRGEDPR